MEYSFTVDHFEMQYLDKEIFHDNESTNILVNI